MPPAFDGWTLVFGHPLGHTSPVDEDEPLLDTLAISCAELSRRFGAAHWYGMSCGDGWTSWCIAEQGEVIRYYDCFEPEKQVGGRHPAEEGYLLPDEDDGIPPDAFDDIDRADREAWGARYQQLKQELQIPDECWATDIAARVSVDPSGLGPHVHMEGHGVLALTACGREHGMPPGALEI